MHTSRCFFFFAAEPLSVQNKLGVGKRNGMEFINMTMVEARALRVMKLLDRTIAQFSSFCLWVRCSGRILETLIRLFDVHT